METNDINQSPTIAWMWLTDSGINALRIDTDRRLLRWYDEIGCACNDNDPSFAQPLADFLQQGAPGLIAAGPHDVMAEIEESVQLLQLAAGL